MKGFIIDPARQTIEEIQLPDKKSLYLTEISKLLDGQQYIISFLYPEEYRTCTGYFVEPRKGEPFFRVREFVHKVKFGKMVVVDRTANGFPQSDKVTLAELEPMITFFS